jgi:hypothetical protein
MIYFACVINSLVLRATSDPRLFPRMRVLPLIVSKLKDNKFHFFFYKEYANDELRRQDPRLP